MRRGRLFSATPGSLNHYASALVLQRQQSDRRRLNMRAQRHSVHDAVSRVPTSVDARTIQKHLDAQTDSFSDASERLQAVNCLMAMMLKAVGMTQLADPDPGPSILVGIKSNVAIHRFEFPSPEPMALSTAL
jgi:hypothetical protein